MTEEIILESHYKNLGIEDPIINTEITKEKIAEKDPEFSNKLKQFTQDY